MRAKVRSTLEIIEEQMQRWQIFAPFKVRVQNVSHTFAVPIDEVKRRIIKTDSDRKAFVRKYFNVDVSDPKYYDLTINTEHLSVEAAVDAIGGAFGRFRQKNPISYDSGLDQFRRP